MTNASRKLQSILIGTAVAVGLGLSAPAGAEELRIGYLAPLTGGLAQTGIDMHPMADYAAKELKLKRVICISEDFAFGHEQMGGFQQTFEDNGGKILKKIWPPLVTPDYTPYVAQISDCDGVCQGFAGSNPLRFMGNPRVLLMDEPSEGLAPQIVAEVMATIRKLKESGLSIVLVEQNPKLVFDVADDIVILNTGRVAVVSTPAKIEKDGVDLRQHLGVF